MSHAQAQLFHFLVTVRAHVHIKLVHLRRLLPARAVANVDGGIPDKALHRSLVPLEDEPASAGGGVVAATDAVHVDEAFLGDVLHHEADLVRVGLQHDLHRGLALDGSPGAAVGVVLRLIRERAHILHPLLLSGGFKAGGTGGGEQVEKKFFGGFVHDSGREHRHGFPPGQPRAAFHSAPVRSRSSSRQSARPAARMRDRSTRRLPAAS